MYVLVVFFSIDFYFSFDFCCSFDFSKPGEMIQILQHFYVIKLESDYVMKNARPFKKSVLISEIKEKEIELLQTKLLDKNFHFISFLLSLSSNCWIEWISKSLLLGILLLI